MTRSIEETPVIQWDYSFLKTHEDDRTLTLLNAYDMVPGFLRLWVAGAHRNQKSSGDFEF